MAVDRIRQQRTPGQFGSEITGLSSPNVTHASFATPGIVDRSEGVGAQGIAIGAQGAAHAAVGAIKLGQEMHEGFALADLEEAQEAEVNSYIESKKNPQIAADAAIDAATLETTSQSLWNKLGEGAEIEDINAIETQYRNKLSTLKAANAQGVMSPDEFAQRTLAVTREAINRNPHMYDEILAHSKKVLGLSGIEAVLKADSNQDDAAAKQYQKRVEAAMQISKENNIPHKYLANGEFDLAHAEAHNAVIQQEKFGADTLARMTDIQSNQDKLAAHQFITGPNGIHAMNGLLNQTSDLIIGTLRSPDNKTDALTLSRLSFNALKQEVSQRAGPLMHLPGVKEQLDTFSKQVDAMQSTFEKFTNQEDQVAFLENQSKIMRERSYQEIAKEVNVETLKVITQLFSTTGAARLVDRNPALMGKIEKTMGNLLSGVSNGLGTDYSIRNERGQNVIASTVDMLSSNIAKGDTSSVNSLNTLIETVWADTKSPKFASTGDKFGFYESFIKAIGNQANKEGFKGLSDVARGKASENLEEYMQITTEGLKKDLAAISGRGTEVKMSVLPDGRLNIQTSNPSDTDMLLKKYGIRINDGLRAFSNLTGSNTKQASEALYQQYDVLKELSPSGFGKREDGTEKGNGFLGVLKRPDGSVSTELSIGVNLGGQDVEIPMLVPTLSKTEIDHLLGGGEPTKAIVDKAAAHARKRIGEGKSPFADASDSKKQEGKPNETNPLNLTIPGKVGKFQSFDNVEEGIRAASTQLDRYFTGKTTGTALKTVSDIAGLWNNENEKGSASKKDYVATIVKHSGLDPNAVLDLTDPSVKADLIYGMAKAEGRSLRPSQILAALGKT